MSEQANLFFWNNQNLFSTNYLQHRLPASDLWKEQKEKAAATYGEISKAYESIKSLKLGPGEEAELENKFIQPVLTALGYAYHVQPRAQRGLRKKVPDYALFKDEESYRAARKVKDTPEQFFSQSLTILEAKYWGRRLNDTDKKDVLDSRDPTAQTVKYLDSVNYHTSGKINWAILANGKLWRVFYFRASSRSGNYFEVDLEDIILRGDVDAFLYFYLFFSKDAFLPDSVTGRTWLDQHLKETEEYASRVSDKLKNLIFDHIFEGLAYGFIEYRRRELGIAQETDEGLKDIFNGCLTLLYRMLFLLYAESRGLLPVNDPDRYYKKSLKKIKEDVSDELKRSGIEGMSHNAYDYWSRLDSLFRILDKGDKALNIPIYNGGLFETVPDGFLTNHKISDPYIAEAIELLTVDPDAEHTPGMTPFIDYSSLNVRHLGDIYEGLLQFHVRVAETEMVEVKEKGKSIWKNAAEVKPGTKSSRPKKTGEVYIENSKHERKATGSYYTPHYIVEYIVANTVGPALKERRDKASALLSELDSLYEKQRKQLKKPADWKHWENPGEPKGKYANEIVTKEHEVFETLFDINVLDPAMGSGHFLVHTVDFISDKIITFLADYPDNPVVRKIDELREAILSNIREQEVTIDEAKLTEVNLIKRMVMKRCIYGIDLNEMAVELAKLSLWLDSFTLGAPLSFLDHHLKCGNSLIGVSDITTVIPMSEIFSEYQKALSFLLQVSELTDATISEAKKSYDLYQQGRNAIEPIRRRFDVTTAQYFMDMGASIKRVQQLAATLDFDNETYPEIVEKCKKALSIAKVKRFLHWRLEFPEVFYTERGEKENAGFECVIGNPPYGLLSKEGYFKHNYSFVNPNWDIYIAFIERGIAVVRRERFVSYIVPVSWETGVMFESLREFLINKMSIKTIINLPFDVFKDAYIDTCIFVTEKSENSDNKTLVYEFPKKARIGKLDIINYVGIEQSCWIGNKHQIIIDSHALHMLPRLFQTCLKLVDITASVRGVLASADFISAKPRIGYDPFFDGEMVRYEISDPDKFICYSDDLPEKPADIGFFKEARVFVRRLISRQDRLMAAYGSDFFINKKDIYIFKFKVANYLPYYLLAVLNAKLLSFLYLSQDTTSKKDDFRQATLDGVRSLPIPRISFTTPEKERKERVDAAIELYEKYMVDLEQKGHADEKREASAELTRSVGGPVAGGKEGKVSGEHPGAGLRVHGVRGRTRKPDDAEGAHEEPEEYNAAPRSTRHIESSLGIKSYAELAPYLAKEVERVMAALLDKSPDELKVTPEFICELHKDAFEGLFPSWAGRYRDRNVKVGEYEPPPYFEVPVLMRSYCDDLEYRLSSVHAQNPVPDELIEAFAFAEGRLLSIHPFRDFNGRVTRMLLFALLRRFDLPPVPLVPDENDKPETETYLNALTEADRMNWQPLIMIWRRRLGLEATE